MRHVLQWTVDQLHDITATLDGQRIPTHEGSHRLTVAERVNLLAAKVPPA